jgi:hypothetical protein
VGEAGAREGGGGGQNVRLEASEQCDHESHPV